MASSEMTHYDKMRALSMAGGKIKTLTGVPPLSFKANGKPLISLSMLGNWRQQGTPTPDSIIPFDGCGEKSINLLKTNNTIATIFNVTTTVYLNRITLNGKASSSGGRTSQLSNVFTLKAGTYTIKASPSNVFQPVINRKSDYKAYVDTFTLTEDTDVYFGINVYDKTYTGETAMVSLVSGASYPANFHPYGFYIPVTCAGQTTPVYLGQVQTVRKIGKLVFDGTETGWQLFTASGVHQFYIDNALTSAAAVSGSSAVSNIAPYGATTANRASYQYGCYAVSSGNGIAFQMVGSAADFPDVTAWKAYLAEMSAAGNPVTVWYILANEQTGIVNEPLAKIGGYADELHINDEITIPTVKGSNTLTVDTDLQPSEMTITYTR